MEHWNNGQNRGTAVAESKVIDIFTFLDWFISWIMVFFNGMK